MIRLRNAVDVHAAPNDVWQVLGDLAATTEWLPGTIAARMEGDTRICTTVDGFDIREQISDYSDERRTYRFKHLAVPVPIRDSEGVFTVKAGSNDGATVVLESSFEAADAAHEGQVAQMMENALQQALESLKRRIETGARWDASGS